VVQTSSDSSLCVPLGDLDHLKILQQTFVTTSVDKCCNNFVFVCKKFYVSSVFSELNSSVGAYVVSNLAQSDILKFHLCFNKAHNFKGVGPHLPFLSAVWKFHKNPTKPRFICAASSTSLTDVPKWLCSFFKAMFPTVNDLWVSKLKKADVPCDSSWILNDSTGVVEVINCFKFLMVQKTALNFRFLWLKNKAEINLFENLHSFKVEEASDLIS
jgi:hypothetical protein